MATRNRAQRGEDQKEFEGRCRKWAKEWQPAGTGAKSKKLKFLRWVPTNDRLTSAPGKRFPELVPVPTPGGKPIPPAFMRPAVFHNIPAQPPAFSLPAQKIKLKLGTSLAGNQAGGGTPSAGPVSAAPTPSAPPNIEPPPPNPPAT